MASAKDYMVDVSAIPKYGPPDFASELYSMIRGIPKAYEEGRDIQFKRGQEARTEELQKPPLDANGNLITDTNQLLNYQLKKEGAAAIPSNITGRQREQFLQENSRPPWDIGAGAGGGGRTVSDLTAGVAGFSDQPNAAPDIERQLGIKPGAILTAKLEDAVNQIIKDADPGETATGSTRALPPDPRTSAPPNLQPGMMGGPPNLAPGSPQGPVPMMSGAAYGGPPGVPAGPPGLGQGLSPFLGTPPGSQVAQAGPPAAAAPRPSQGLQPTEADPAAHLVPPQLRARGVTSEQYARWLGQQGNRAEALGFKDPAALAHANKIWDALNEAENQTRQSGLAIGRAEADKAIAQMDKLSEVGLDAKGHIAMLDTVKRLGEKVPYGVIPRIKSELGKFGIETEGLSDIQAYQRAIDYMAPQLRPIGSGRLLKTELDAFKNALGDLMTTKEGREISVENLKLLSEYQEQIGGIASDHRIPVTRRMEEIYKLPPPQLKTLGDIAASKPATTFAPGSKLIYDPSTKSFHPAP